MSWSIQSAFDPSLPGHCAPENDFLLRFSQTFHVCVPTKLAFISSLLGALSIASWLFAQLPQIYRNYRLQSTSGLSIFFLVEWCLGDLGNLLGALFTHQARWQVLIGGYYVFVDMCLVGQWVWYERLKHGRPLLRAWKKQGKGRGNGSSGGLDEVTIEGMDPRADGSQSGEISAARPRPIFRNPTFKKERSPENEKGTPSPLATPGGTTIQRVGPSSPMPSPSPRTMLLIACLIALAQASPLNKPISPLNAEDLDGARPPTPLENAGTILSWMSTVLYLSSRLPQLYKNYRRKSTAGLSPILFIAAFCGNSFYSAAMLTNPCLWHDFAAYGGGGWAGPEGSSRMEWALAALPFFLGAAGVLGLDGAVGVQFMLYGEGESKVVVIVEGEESRGARWRWRRVSGWMRGWVPSISEASRGEREALLENRQERGEGYGAL